jgi:hypothetical protein
MDLIEFLLACFAEDEAVATDEAVARVTAGTVVAGPGEDGRPAPLHVVDQIQESLIDLHRSRPWQSPWTPAHVLAKCKADRRIVEGAQRVMLPDPRDYWQGAHDTMDGVLRLLALPYADRPGYRDEWKP